MTCINCKSIYFRKEPLFKLINPHGEFVEGYGHMPVSVQSGYQHRCNLCGFIVGGNPIKIKLSNQALKRNGDKAPPSA